MRKNPKPDKNRKIMKNEENKWYFKRQRVVHSEVPRYPQMAGESSFCFLYPHFLH